jgi:hypothetical protein
MPRIVRKLPIASSGGEPKINCSGEDWKRIEKAYGKKLPGELRLQILGATTEFVRFEVFERTVEPLSWAIDRIQRVKKGAAQFYKALFDDPRHESDAHVYANHLIKKHFEEPRLPAADMLNHVSWLLSSVLVACNRALREIETSDLEGHREGDCWEQWIRRLTKALSTYDLPTGARTDSDKAKTGLPSPFVSLVSELQKCVPPDSRRHMHSYEGLAKAITRARSKVRDGKTTGASLKTSRKVRS